MGDLAPVTVIDLGLHAETKEGHFPGKLVNGTVNLDELQRRHGLSKLTTAALRQNGFKPPNGVLATKDADSAQEQRAAAAAAADDTNTMDRQQESLVDYAKTSPNHGLNTAPEPTFHKVQKLFTPGPLGVSLTTKQAMLRDLGSRDDEFISVVKDVRAGILEIAGAPEQKYTCVPIQGSGTFGLEAALGTAVPRDGKVLILANGAYGKRLAKICEVLQIAHHMELFGENQRVSPSKALELMNADSDTYSMVAMAHCETSSGVFNPVNETGILLKEKYPNCAFFVDAMSTFGAVELNVETACIDYLVSSANKCLEGVPGFAFVVANKQHLTSCKGYARSYSMDLLDQYEGLERTGQFRFTPPTHVFLALKQALDELKEEGGRAARAKRYQDNRAVLKKGMKEMGFQEFLDTSHTGYIITSYNYPNHPNFNFQQFCQRLRLKDQIIYPGKVLHANCFRIGNIGHLFPADMEHLLECIKLVCQEMKMELPLKN